MYAQQSTALPIRVVSGVVMDSSGKVELPGASIKLIAGKDTVYQVTNEDGVFVFREVKSAEFFIGVNMMGYQPFYQKYLFNDTKPRITIPPVILRVNAQLLEGVTIKGKVGPKMLGDTTQFWADDYIVRDYAKLEELVKKLEGVEVDKDGNVTFMGQQVNKALFNGIKYFGGNVKNIIKELPANIVERIQIIDDYGEQSTAAGLKQGEPNKTLNIISKKDKSVANLFDITLESNIDDRHEARGYAKRVDGLKQLELQAGIETQPMGVQQGAAVGTISNAKTLMQSTNTSNSDMSGGDRRAHYAVLTFKDKLNARWRYELGYQFKSQNESYFKKENRYEYYDKGIIWGNNLLTTNQHARQHEAKVAMFYQKSDQTKFNISFGWNNDWLHVDKRNQINQSGLINAQQLSIINNNTQKDIYRVESNYSHIFVPSKAVITASIKIQSNPLYQRKQDDNLITYTDSTQYVKDSVYNLLNKTNDHQQQHFANATFTYHFSERTTMVLLAQSNYNVFNHQQIVSNVQENGSPYKVDSLSRNYVYKTLETPFSINFRRILSNQSSINIGARFSHVNINAALLNPKNTLSKSYAIILPEFNYEFAKGTNFQFSTRYYGSVQLPRFEEVMPIPDYSNPLQVVVGNPSLKPTVLHSFSFRMTKLFKPQAFTIGLLSQYLLPSNKVTQQVTLYSKTPSIVTRETSFTQVNGNNSWNGMYHLTKTFDHTSYSVKFEGRWNRSKMISFFDKGRNIARGLQLNHTLTFSGTPISWLDVNLAAQWEQNNSKHSLPLFPTVEYAKKAVNLYGKLFFTKTFLMGFDINQSFYESEDATLNRQPFVVGMNIEKRVFRQKNGVVSLLVMDLFKQYQVVNRRLLMNGYVDIQSNTNSRFFMLQFSWSPQQWSGGKNMNKERRNDGSFID
ncbi:TonB-dependent receptor [Chitinophaga skermanii]|nr:TonB-dependent receptor [Chitinophaga skermanii]